MKKFINLLFIFFIAFLTNLFSTEIYKGYIGNVPYEAHVYGEVANGNIYSTSYISILEPKIFYTPYTSAFMLSKKGKSINN